MATDFSISARRSDLPRLRRRIISAYQSAQGIINKTTLAPSSRMHALTLAYDKACTHMRSDIAQATSSFPNMDALLTWLLDGLPDEIMLEKDCRGLELAVRELQDEIEKAQKRH